MGNNLIGKCFWVNGQLIKVTDEYSINPTYESYYRHEAISQIANSYGIGYKLSSGVYYLGKDIQQVDSIIWDKTLKLMKLSNLACASILSSADVFPTHTGYTKLVYMYSNIVKVISPNESLLITPEQLSMFRTHEIDRFLFLQSQIVRITLTANISKDTYDRVCDNIVDTCNRIKDLWT